MVIITLETILNEYHFCQVILVYWLPLKHRQPDANSMQAGYRGTCHCATVALAIQTSTTAANLSFFVTIFFDSFISKLWLGFFEDQTLHHLLFESATSSGHECFSKFLKNSFIYYIVSNTGGKLNGVSFSQIIQTPFCLETKCEEWIKKNSARWVTCVGLT